MPSIHVALCLIALCPLLAAQAPPRVVFDFEGSDARAEWRAVNDSVMGGVSRGGPSVENGILVFSGETRLENNGGFSSVQSNRRDLNLAGATAIVVRVRGSAERTFKLQLETNARDQGWRIAYWQDFQLNSAGWQDVTLPITGFKPTRFGFELPGPALEVAEIRSIGFMLYDKQAGPFRLECELIAARFDPLVEAATEDSTSVLALAKKAGNFQTLLAAIEAAGLSDTLRGSGPFTVLAPTDEAFAKLGQETIQRLLRPERRDELRRILTLHVIAGAKDALAIARAEELTTLEGTALKPRIEGGRLFVQEAGLSANDIAAGNGVIHVLDAVLLPAAGNKPGATASLIELAIERGVPLFNAGQPEACAAIYELAITALVTLEAKDLTDPVRADLVTALAAAERAMNARDAAWEMRKALDAAWQSLPRAVQNTARPTSRNRH